MLHICPRLPHQPFLEPPFEEEILAFLRFLGHSRVIRKLTDVNINNLNQPWRSFDAIINKCLTGKSSGYDSLRSSSDTTITPPTAAAGPRLTTSEKGKQAAKASKAKSLSALSKVAITEAQQLKLVTKRSLQQIHISQASGSCTDEGTGSIPGVLDVPTNETMDTIIDQQVARDEEFWATVTVHHHAIRFKMDNKNHIVNLESFREMLHICPRLPHQPFVEPPFEEEILAFLHFLGHSRVIRKLTDVNINNLNQPWRSFDAIINKCPRLTTSEKGKQAAKASKANSLSALSKVAITEAQQLKLVTKRSLQQTHISQASGSCADEGTGSIPGVLDVPTNESEEELSWNSTDEEGDDDEGKDGDGDDDGEEGDGDDDDEDDDGEEGNDDDDQEDEGDDGEDDEDDEGNGEEDLGLNVDREEGHDEEEEEDELYRDININQGMGIQTTQEVKDSHVTLTPVNPDGMESIFETTSQMDAQNPILVAPLPMSASTLTSSTIATITTTQQAPLPPTIALSTLLQDLPNFGSLFCFDNRLRTLEANFFEFIQTNQFARAVSAILEIVQRYMDQRMNEAVKVQVSKILPKIEQTVNEQLEAEVLTRSSHSSKTSYAVAADLYEMELKNIIIEKMEGNKSIHQSNEQRNLYKALVNVVHVKCEVQ
uniref:Uncharacterized protein n=1 Tax=Tanacetum cinerariifolium TaxID=118510 RepID=A0A699IBK0_TANCI|nr:hypothetical protein [Tanacetum cinerariifolium]